MLWPDPASFLVPSGKKFIGIWVPRHNVFQCFENNLTLWAYRMAKHSPITCLLRSVYLMDPSCPNWADATTFSYLELFLVLLLARKYDIISHASYLPLSWTNKIFLLYCLVIQNGGQTSLESSVSESEAEDSDEETDDGECKSSDSQRRKTPKAKTNGTTWVRVSLCPQQNR